MDAPAVDVADGPAALDFPELALDGPGPLADAVRDGLPADRFDALLGALGVPTAELAAALHLSPSTLSRRRRQGRFDVVESDRLVRLAALVAHAVRVMETVEDARAWMTSPARALGGETPLAYASVEPGAREVDRLLTRIEHGVFS
ncbi:antitoxin Xre-like helix-turn-helix domain-containing protein [Rubrivirga sp. S365]|uniref:type II RES/Xre toxin-antitoxin system antitoxin n=1 Tax=Rubrivirga sp. S365 TaxID=3076080 RepID=UPI0028C74814|nr:antitoxin Xre-like helix-turn-helix domain-containing protein [Rubrivirga sp. S365]MDT7858182.1 antitoxin Xre-like helix-turn-helix domain-containing protein [Rubrivirga sp. S365]